MHVLTAADYFRNRPLALLMAFTVLLRCETVLADTTDTVKLTLSETLNYDNNLFRLSDGVKPTVAAGNSDRSSSIAVRSLGLKIDKAYSQQNLHLETSIDKTHYGNYGELDFTGRNLNLKWDWKFTSKFTGTVQADRKQTLASFADYRNTTTRNVQTTSNRSFNLDYWAFGGWHLFGNIGKISTVTEDPTVVTEDAYRASSTEAGVKFVFRSSSSVSVLGRKLNGHYPNPLIPASLLDTGFQQNAREIRATWLITGKSILDGRITNVDQKHSNFSQRDYAGNTGSINYNWRPTAKVGVQIGLGREISDYPSIYSNYIATNSVTLTPVWQLTEKTSLKMRVKKSSRDYLGKPFGPVPVERQDKQSTAQMEMTWNAARSINISAILLQENRKSNFPGLDYKDKQAGLKVVFTF